MSAEVGERAPGFSLVSAAEEEVTLEEYKGEGATVLLFVPLAFTPVCTNELRVVRDEYDFYKEHKARVLAASVDSPYTLKVWSDQLKLPFPLLSDFNKEAAAAYDALYDDLMGLRGVAKRAAFVIDEDGIVRYRWVSEDAGQLPEFEEIKEAVKKVAAT